VIPLPLVSAVHQPQRLGDMSMVREKQVVYAVACLPKQQVAPCHQETAVSTSLGTSYVGGAVTLSPIKVLELKRDFLGCFAHQTHAERVTIV
jgi:hypothetical protein